MFARLEARKNWKRMTRRVPSFSETRPDSRRCRELSFPTAGHLRRQALMHNRAGEMNNTRPRAGWCRPSACEIFGNFNQVFRRLERGRRKRARHSANRDDVGSSARDPIAGARKPCAGRYALIDIHSRRVRHKRGVALALIRVRGRLKPRRARGEPRG